MKAATISKAPIYRFLDAQMSIPFRIVIVMTGALLLSLLAQVTIPLPWTPVPITGQTFGVTLMALLLGRRLAISAFILYFGMGALGLPVFALGKAGFVIGPTMGYLFGMMLSTYVVGGLSDRGWLNSTSKALVAGFTGSLIVMSCGLFVLSYFLPTDQLLAAGLIPFLPGDLIKTTSAVLIARAARFRG